MVALVAARERVVEQRFLRLCQGAERQTILRRLDAFLRVQDIHRVARLEGGHQRLRPDILLHRDGARCRPDGHIQFVFHILRINVFSVAAGDQNHGEDCDEDVFEVHWFVVY